MANTPIQDRIELAVAGRRKGDKLPRHAYVGTSKRRVMFDGSSPYVDYDSQFSLSFQLLNWDMKDSGEYTGFKSPAPWGELSCIYNNVMNVIEKATFGQAHDLARSIRSPQEFARISPRRYHNLG